MARLLDGHDVPRRPCYDIVCRNVFRLNGASVFLKHIRGVARREMRGMCLERAARNVQIPHIQRRRKVFEIRRRVLGEAVTECEDLHSASPAPLTFPCIRVEWL